MELIQFKQLKKMSKTDMNAKFLLGMAYKNGYQVKVDLKKAKSSFGYVAWKAEDVKLKLKAKEEYVDTMLYDDCGSEYIIRECNDLLNIRNNKTKKKNENGYSYLAEVYLSEEQYPAAIATLKTAETENASKCYFVWGMLYKEGKIIDKNETKAFEYFTKSAEAGDYRGVRELGVCYMFGIGTPKNVNKAIEYLDKASQELDRESRLYLARCILENCIEERYNDAIKILKTLDYKLPSNDEKAQEYLYVNALCYFDGKGIKQNVKYGIKLLKKYMLKNEDALKLLVEKCKGHMLYNEWKKQLRQVQKQKEKNAIEHEKAKQKLGVNIETASDKDVKNVKIDTPFYGGLSDVYSSSLKIFTRCPNCGDKSLTRKDSTHGQLRRTVMWEDEYTHRYAGTTNPVDYFGETKVQSYTCKKCGFRFEKITNEKLEEKEISGFIKTKKDVYSIVTVECNAKSPCSINAQNILRSVKSKTKTKKYTI